MSRRMATTGHLPPTRLTARVATGSIDRWRHERKGDDMNRWMWVCVPVFLQLCIMGRCSASPGPFLVYESGTSQNQVAAAMTALGFSYDLRSAANPVTAADLASHEALVVGWASGGIDMSGLNPAILAAGVTGNRLLTGHDADYHTAIGVPAAAALMSRYVQFAAADAGTGLLAFPVYQANPFSYLPPGWGITAFDSLTSETIDQITPQGVASGLYSGLTTADLSNWEQSFHAGFTAWGPDFQPFEMGHPPSGTYVTIGTTVTPVSIPAPGRDPARRHGCRSGRLAAAPQGPVAQRRLQGHSRGCSRYSRRESRGGPAYPGREVGMVSPSMAVLFRTPSPNPWAFLANVIASPFGFAQGRPRTASFSCANGMREAERLRSTPTPIPLWFPCPRWRRAVPRKGRF